MRAENPLKEELKTGDSSAVSLTLLYITGSNWGGPSARGQWAGGLRAATRTPSSGVTHGLGLIKPLRSCDHRLQSHPSWSLKARWIDCQEISETLH
jgi:hypothetical protein